MQAAAGGIVTMRSWIQSLLLYGFGSGLLFIGACDEYLPSYREPSAVLGGKVEANYILTSSDNRVGIAVTAINRYEESLEGRRVFNGSIEIRSKREPELRKTLNVSSAHLVYARFHNSQTGMVRMDPGDSVRFLVSWNLAGADTPGDNEFLGLFSYYIDPTCPGPPPRPMRTIAFRETFILSGELRVFDQASPAIIGPTEFSFCRVSRWVAPSACPSVDQRLCASQ